MPDFLAASLYFLRMYNAATVVITEAGGDIEDVLDEIAADNQLAESKGVELDADQVAISLNQSADGF